MAIQITQVYDAPFTLRLGWMLRARAAGDPQDHRLGERHHHRALHRPPRQPRRQAAAAEQHRPSRGWWGDTDTAAVWGGWPIGSPALAAQPRRDHGQQRPGRFYDRAGPELHQGSARPVREGQDLH